MSNGPSLFTVEFRRILVLQLSPIGDTIMAIPALRALRKGFPAATIAVMAAMPGAELLYGLPCLDILRACRNGLDLARAILEYRRLSFDLSIGLSHQGSWLAPFTGSPCRTGLHAVSPARTPVGDGGRQPIHVIDRYLAVIGQLGVAISEDGLSPEICLSPGDRERAGEFIARHRLQSPLVAIHPGGRHFPFKRWPLDRYAALADALAAQGFSVVLVGGDEDVKIASALATSTRCKPVVSAGRLRLRETAALLARCRLFVGNDSAPLHMAAAVGTPTVGIFGPTDPSQFGPGGPQHTVVRKAPPCSPCFKFYGGLWQYWPRCARPACMEAIEVPDVMAAVLRQTSLDTGPT